MRENLRETHEVSESLREGEPEREKHSLKFSWGRGEIDRERLCLDSARGRDWERETKRESHRVRRGPWVGYAGREMTPRQTHSEGGGYAVRREMTDGLCEWWNMERFAKLPSTRLSIKDQKDSSWYIIFAYTSRYRLVVQSVFWTVHNNRLQVLVLSIGKVYTNWYSWYRYKIQNIGSTSSWSSTCFGGTSYENDWSW